MNNHKENRWAFVTGASSGIGRQLAIQSAKAGYSVIVCARRAEKLNELKNELTSEYQVKCHTITADLGTESEIVRLIDELKSLDVDIDLFFNNAGFGLNGEFCEMKAENQLNMIDVNCRGVVQLSYFVANLMKTRGSGTIVHTASMGGLSPTPYYAVYGATKAFVVSFSLALSEELKNTSVCVKVLCPGATETEFASVSNFKGADPGSGNLQTSEEVARETMRKISGNPDIIIPGFKNRVAACIVNLLPRSWTLKMAATSLAPREAA